MMTPTMDLFIVRHGNTFGPHDVVRRVGGRTDIPLVASGREQAKAVGQWLQSEGYAPAIIMHGPLSRQQETAELIAQEVGYKQLLQQITLSEIDYGVDENQPEAAVVERLGRDVLTAWDQDGVIPPGWAVNKAAIQQGWASAAAQAQAPCSVIVTSNGSARFANILTGQADCLPKLKTGAYGHLRGEAGQWQLISWNVRP